MCYVNNCGTISLDDLLLYEIYPCNVGVYFKSKRLTPTFVSTHPEMIHRKEYMKISFFLFTSPPPPPSSLSSFVQNLHKKFS